MKVMAIVFMSFFQQYTNHSQGNELTRYIHSTIVDLMLDIIYNHRNTHELK